MKKNTRLNGARRAGERGMAKALRLKVTQQNIGDGIPGSPSECAVAQALLTRFPKAEFITCTAHEIAWSDPDRKVRTKYFVTGTAAEAIKSFDNGCRPTALGVTMEPCTVNLDTGVYYPTGWKAKHPNSIRVRAYARPVVRKRAVRYTRNRVNGECVRAAIDGTQE